MKTLNVCLYTPTSSGGHALYTKELLTAVAEAGADRGVAAELVTCEDLEDGLWTEAYPIHAILPHLRPRSAFRSSAAWLASRLAYYSRREGMFLDWVTRRGGVDVVHFQEYTPWLAPRHWRALRRRGVRTIYTVHNILLHGYKNALHKVVRDSCLRAGWRECDALLVHTEGLREKLADFLGPGHPPIHVTPHAVWSRGGPQEPIEVEPSSARTRLLFFGVVRQNKGLHILLRALGRLPNCDLTAAGEIENDGYRDRIRELSGHLAPGRFELIDRYVSEDEVPGLFASSRLVVLPYTSFAAQSGVLHLALAHGRPVVASDIGGMGECVRNWGIGQVVAPDDDVALAAAIQKALEPSAYRDAVDATLRVRRDLTWERMAEATIDVYRAVAS
ncbi:MAG: glycosyltransferase family 4 protein [Isosphaeraceae bacterium]|nr:glycosyltransferase family 4 protein [Isosphaeraceae bacterium]